MSTARAPIPSDCRIGAGDDPLIVAQRFTYRYPPFQPDGEPVTALRDLTFAIATGERVAIAGPSGSGLTTLCLALTGLVPHETGGSVAGQLRLAGLDTTTASPAELSRHVALVFQEPEANLLGLTVAEEVAFALELRGLPISEIERRVRWALELVGLSAERDRPASRLSGGQKQRLALAIALALQPKVLVLDEPTAQLDPRGRTELLAGLHRLLAEQETAITLVLASRDSDLLLGLADRLLGLQAGQLVVDTATRDVFVDPSRVEGLGLREPQLVALARLLREAGLPGIPAIFRDVDEAATLLRALPPDLTARQLAPFVSAGQIQPERASVAYQPHREPVVVIERLRYRYPDGTEALRGIDLIVRPGEIVALVGPNGSGKTTLARHVIGALRPCEGRVLVAGLDTRQCTIAELADTVGYVAQNPDQQLTRPRVADEVAFGLRQRGLQGDELAQRVEAALELAGLRGAAAAHPASLSRGQRQLLVIAAALARRPRLLVLDEPTSSLDRQGSERLVAALRAHTATGGSVLLISHDLELVTRCADRVVLLHRGQQLATGSPLEILGDLALLQAADLTPLPVTELAARLGLPPTLTPPELLANLAERSTKPTEAAPAAHRRSLLSAGGEEHSASVGSPALTAGQEAPAPFLCDLEAAVKLGLVVGAAVCVLLWQSPLLLALATALLHLALWRAGGFSAARLASVWRGLAPLLVLVLLLRPLFERSDSSVLVTFGPIHLTLAGLLAAFGAALRLVTLALLALVWIGTTSERALVQGLLRLRLPLSLGLALTIGLRFIPLFAETFTVASEALQTRGLRIPPRGWARLRALLLVLLAALVATLRQAQHLGWALTVRGLGTARAGTRPVLPPLQRRDRLALGLGLAAETALFVATLAGLGRSPLWPFS